MAEITVGDFAKAIGIPAERLLAQLREAGLPHTQAADRIVESEKSQLHAYLRRMHGKDEQASEPSKITLSRKTVSEIKIIPDKAKSRLRVTKPTATKTVSVEIRRKRTYVKRSVVAEEEAARIEKEGAELERVRQEALATMPAPPEVIADAIPSQNKKRKTIAGQKLRSFRPQTSPTAATQTPVPM